MPVYQVDVTDPDMKKTSLTVTTPNSATVAPVVETVTPAVEKMTGKGHGGRVTRKQRKHLKQRTLGKQRKHRKSQKQRK